MSQVCDHKSDVSVRENILSDETFNKHLEKFSDTPWVQELKKEYWQKFNSLDMPTRRDEEWRFANPGEIQLDPYVKTIAPEKEDIVKLYSGKVSLFEYRGINKQIKATFGRKVNLKSGAYLIIDHTEAMHVIDVNSGNRKATNTDQELNALDTNLESAEEIARLLRLRDMGGIVAIDFIDMYDRANNKKLVESFKQFMKGDKAKHNIQAPSRFGVVELTRQRVRPETEIKTTETCPTCFGKGEVQASILIIDEIESVLNSILNEGKAKSINLNVHPFIDAFLKKGFKSIQRSWFLKHKKWVNIHPITDYGILEFQFMDDAGKVL